MFRSSLNLNDIPRPEIDSVVGVNNEREVIDMFNVVFVV